MFQCQYNIVMHRFIVYTHTHTHTHKLRQQNTRVSVTTILI